MILTKLSFAQAAEALMSGNNIKLFKVNETSYNVTSINYNREENFIGIYGEKPNINSKFAFMFTPNFEYIIDDENNIYVLCEDTTAYIISMG